MIPRTCNSVKMIAHTPHPLEIVVGAYRKCYQSEGKSDSSEWELGKNDEIVIKKALSHGHESPLEHVSVTFDMDMSRAAQTQLVRHRIASFSIESMRYCKPGAFFIPEAILNMNDEYVALEFKRFLSSAQSFYDKLVESGVKKEDARYVLPLATKGEIRMTMNLRELRHFIAERTCKHAQKEIRDIALTVKEIVAKIHPIFVFRCEKFWHCPSGDQCKACLGVSL